MADPVLTSLCAICHVSTPKYKCPRCNLRTCSLACIKKHKAWSECSGERDATAYVRPSKLRTPAGVDHDYNFIHGIEMSVERTEKILVGERGLVKAEELRPLTVQEVKWKTGKDGRKRKVVITRVLKEAKGRTFEKHLSIALKKANVHILCAPTGLGRQRDNHTTLNRRTGRINWQVEWLALDGDGPAKHPLAADKRLLSKVMDDLPIYRAYHELLDERKVEAVKPKVRGQRSRPHQSQNSTDSRWTADMDGLQDALTGMWLSPAEVDAEEDKRRREQYQFFLGGTQGRSDMPTKITALEPGDTLKSILRHTQVLEFPTIYTIVQGTTLPPGFVLGPKDAAFNAPPAGLKRKNGAAAGGRDNKQFKKRKPHGAPDREDGEIGSDAEEGEGAPDEETSGGVGLEAGEVIAEQSFDEDEAVDEDDETSSSGSDSD